MIIGDSNKRKIAKITVVKSFESIKQYHVIFKSYSVRKIYASFTVLLVHCHTY